MGDKKTVLIGSIRLSEKTATAYWLALEYYNLRRSDYARMCIDQLIKNHRAEIHLELPIRFASRTTSTKTCVLD